MKFYPVRNLHLWQNQFTFFLHVPDSDICALNLRNTALSSIVRKKTHPKTNRNPNTASSEMKTQHTNKEIFFRGNCLCLGSPWTSQDDTTLSPRRTWWVPGGALWSIRHFGQKVCIAVSPQPVFCEDWIAAQEWSVCIQLDKDHEQSISWHLLRSFQRVSWSKPRGILRDACWWVVSMPPESSVERGRLGIVWSQDVAQSLLGGGSGYRKPKTSSIKAVIHPR